MAKVCADLRNQHTTLDSARAKKRGKKQCATCGTGIDGGNKKYCSPCYAISYDEKLAARRLRSKAKP